MNIFKIEFEPQEKLILKKYKMLIKNNERLYLFDSNDNIPVYGTPRKYDVHNFHYEGNSWKSLIFEFGNWFLDQTRSLSISDYLEINKGFIKSIFSINQEINYIGPLNNGLFINNNLGVFAWNMIIYLLDYLNINDKGIVYIHFPFSREYKEVATLIWIREVKLFYRYLRGLGYSENSAKVHIENLKKMVLLYYNNNSVGLSYTNSMDITNAYFPIIDNRLFLSTVISKLKKYQGYTSSYHATLDNLVTFKKEIYYEDENYSNFIINNI